MQKRELQRRRDQQDTVTLADRLYSYGLCSYGLFSYGLYR